MGWLSCRSWNVVGVRVGVRMGSVGVGSRVMGVVRSMGGNLIIRIGWGARRVFLSCKPNLSLHTMSFLPHLPPYPSCEVAVLGKLWWVGNSMKAPISSIGSQHIWAFCLSLSLLPPTSGSLFRRSLSSRFLVLLERNVPCLFTTTTPPLTF